MNIVLSCQNLSKTYQEGPLLTPVLKQVNFSVATKERVAIVGSSGSGKSTLLHLLGGLDTPSEGEVLLNGSPFSTLSQDERGQLRNRYLGFVYQFHHLLPELSALENVSLPLLIAGKKVADAQAEAAELLNKVGLLHRLKHKPSELSGGERQRVALARALVTRPSCVLADEPTGNLDKKTAEAVYELMLALNEQLGTSFVIVTHDLTLAAKMNRTVWIEDGQLLNQ